MGAARKSLGRAIDERGELDLDPKSPMKPNEERLVMLSSVSMGGFLWAAILSVLAAVVCRGGVLMRALGIAVVTRNGSDASRGRMLVRAVVAWSWLPLGVTVCAFLTPVLGLVGSLVLVVGAVIAVTTWSAVTAGRSLQDRVAGTWLVPR